MRVWDYFMRRKGLLCILVAVFAVSVLFGTRLFSHLGTPERLAEVAAPLESTEASNHSEAPTTSATDSPDISWIQVAIAEPTISPSIVESDSDIPVPHTGSSAASSSISLGATPAEIIGAALFLTPSAASGADASSQSATHASAVAAWQTIAYSTTAALVFGALALAVARFLC